MVVIQILILLLRYSLITKHGIQENITSIKLMEFHERRNKQYNLLLMGCCSQQVICWLCQGYILQIFCTYLQWSFCVLHFTIVEAFVGVNSSWTMMHKLEMTLSKKNTSQKAYESHFTHTLTLAVILLM